MSRGYHKGGFTRAPGAGAIPHRPALSPQAARRAWVELIELAGQAAETARRAGEAEPSPDLAPLGVGLISRLMVAVRDPTPENFPLEPWSARRMAAAFLSLARDFANPNMGPEARTACAAFLGAGAACLDGLLTDLRAEEARSWRGQTGEREED
jgi:hypothetical protein